MTTTKKDVSHDKTPVQTGKNRYWWAVLWDENLPSDWRDTADDLLQQPYCYCTHNQDVDSEGNPRKTHTHMILAFSGPTTYKRALSVFQLLGKDAVNSCEGIINMRYAYNYLIHNTESCKKKEKHLYQVEERHSRNNFDIGQYEQLSSQVKDEMLVEMINTIIETRLENIVDFLILAETRFNSPEYFSVIRTYNSFLERVCKGNYLKYHNFKKSQALEQGECKKGDGLAGVLPDISKISQSEKNCGDGLAGEIEFAIKSGGDGLAGEIEKQVCPNCGSDWFVKDGSMQGRQRYKCKECGHKFM